MDTPKPSNYPIAGLDNLVADAGAIDAVLATLDAVVIPLEGKWGAGRLPMLVEPDLAAKFGSAQAKLNAAVESGNVPEVVNRAAILKRGWLALDAAASPNLALERDQVWGYDHQGKRYIVVLDRSKANWQASHAQDASLVVTVAELLTVWEASKVAQVTRKAKLVFPGSQVTRVTTDKSLADDLNDEIPF